MTNKKKIILEVKNLNIHAGPQPIVKDVSFNLYQNEIVSIVGSSGCGKSTILRTINRLAQENGLDVNGNIYYRGDNVFECCSINNLRKHIGLVFQKPCIFPGSIYRNVLFGVKHHSKLNKNEKKELVETVLQKAHLWNEVKDRLEHPAFELSLGQKQRLAFARTLAVDPEILLLDEPTSSLDPHSTQEIESALLEMKRSKTILLVTHLLDQGKRMSDRIIFLSAAKGYGQVVEEGTPHEIFNKPKFEETQRYFSKQKNS